MKTTIAVVSPGRNYGKGFITAYSQGYADAINYISSKTGYKKHEVEITIISGKEITKRTGTFNIDDFEFIKEVIE
jgi:hypothetical protein